MKGMFKVTVFLTIVAMMAVSAFATPTIRITSGAATCTLADGGASVCAGGGVGSADSVALAGGVSGTFSVGVFVVNVGTGITKPLNGSASSPFMDLATSNTSTGAGTLVLEFSETGFTAGGNAFLRFGGTAEGNAVYAAFSDAGNALFATTTALGSSGAQSGAYGGSVAGAAPVGATYSLTQRITITHTAGGTSSSDNELRVPEPGILSLLGIGLAGLGLIRRRLS